MHAREECLVDQDVALHGNTVNVVTGTSLQGPWLTASEWRQNADATGTPGVQRRSVLVAGKSLSIQEPASVGFGVFSEMLCAVKRCD